MYSNYSLLSSVGRFTIVMSVIGMDPLLRRGIRLMLSKAPDALDQLKALAEEAIVAKQRNVTGKMVNVSSFILSTYIFFLYIVIYANA